MPHPELMRLYDVLGSERTQFVRGKIDTLLGIDQIVALFVHGSFSRGLADEMSDLDIIVVVNDDAFEAQVARLWSIFERDSSVAVTARTERFPWFGYLEAAIYPGSEWFSIEVGFVKNSDLSEFYVEPDAWVIKDTGGEVRFRRDRCRENRTGELRRERENSGYELLNLAIKFKKAISRKHLWNAYNYCSSARRMLIELERQKIYGDEKIFVGIPDRRVESELSECFIQKLVATAPRYCVEEIVCVFLLLFDEVFERIYNNTDQETKRWLHSWREHTAKLSSSQSMNHNDAI